uniref:Uncharacterized protein n=1 Tax=uncultured prokaryote TaxID=198431 RepID=A0A0H5Q648_9ZZZZ|nr:hypothetical protein [uncultured prokaryote]
MNHVLTNLIAHVETMIVIALIILGALAKGMRILSKRLSKSRLILETDSLTLNWQAKQHSLPQELPQQEQQGDDEDGNSDNDNGRIPTTLERPQF